MYHVLFHHVLVYQIKEIESTLLTKSLMYHVLFSHVSRTFFSCITYFFLMYHVLFSHLSPHKPLIILTFLHPQSIYKVSYKVSMKVTPLEKKALFFLKIKKKRPIQVFF